MKIIIFAGGSGKRFWPISRESKPKQFIPIKEGKSTFQLMVERMQPIFGWHNIFVSTNERYIPYIKRQVPQISLSNIFTEPARRDVGPAVGLALIRLRKMGVNEPIGIVWADHFIRDLRSFQKIFTEGEKTILKKETKLLFVGEVPTYATNNLGWISIGNSNTNNVCDFKGFEYRPSLDKCKKLFKEKSALWNTGYIISSIDYLLSVYKEFQPSIYSDLLKIEDAIDTSEEGEVIQNVYPKMDAIHFDHCVPHNVKPNEAKVIKTEIGWDDPGTLYALKNYLKSKKENLTKGNVYAYETTDSMVYNFEDKKLVTSVFLDGMVVINTKDALLVVHKDHVRNVSDMIKELEETKYQKYL